MKSTFHRWIENTFTRRGRRPAGRATSRTAGRATGRSRGRTVPGIEALECRAVPTAVPSAVLSVPANPFIGETMKLSVTFDNTAANLPGNTGYGPYLDLVLPANGIDGYTLGSPTPPQDGITYKPGSATFLGQPVTTTVLTFDPLGQAVHPYAVTGVALDGTPIPLIVTGTPGDQLVVFQLPFGSFTPNQPAAVIELEANVSNLADVNAPLTIQASAGFQFGADPLDNPATDPSLLGAPVADMATPTLLKLTKTYIGPEDETATGPNYPRQYRIDVDIADGQTLTNLDLTDKLPKNLQYQAVDGTFIRGTPTATTALATPSTSVPGGTLTRRFATVTGTTAANDATLLFTFHVPKLDADGVRVIDPLTGDDVLSPDDARAEGDWAPIDLRDPLAHPVSDATAVDHLLTDKSIAIQKGVAIVSDTGPAGPSPGDVLEYTLDFQVSDFFAFENVTIPADIFSDGQAFYGPYPPDFSGPWTPRLRVTQDGYTTDVPFALANYTVTWNGDNNPLTPATDGSTTLTFSISQQLIDGYGLGQPSTWAAGQLVGGLVPALGPGNRGATTGRITFRTQILDQYTDTYPSGNASLNQGDTVSNSAVIRGDVLDETTLLPTGFSEEDGSAAGVVIAQGALSKSVYAVNGMVGAPAIITPGDTVTYRLKYQLLIGDFENFLYTDYLPLPIFLAGDPDANGVPGPAFTFDPGPIPGAGQFTRGPLDTQFARSGIVPTASIDADSNSITFSYGTYDDPTNTTAVIDLLFTVTATDQPFADRLFLTNQVRQTDNNTAPQDAILDAIVQVQVTEPVLGISKGVVATDNPAANLPGPVGPVTFQQPGLLTSGSGSAVFTGTVTSSGLVLTPINQNLTGSDAGDLVTFAIVVENTGSGPNGAFDVQVKDTLPVGFVLPTGPAGLNLRVTDGTGAAFTWTNVGGGLGLFDQGIELTDPGPTDPAAGALDPGKTQVAGTVIDNGRNILVLTYDLQVAGTVTPPQTIENTATLTRYASREGGPDFAGSDPSDKATVAIAPPVVAKHLTGTEVAGPGNNAANQAVIGELATYTVTLNVPDGANVTGATIVDTLDPGLSFVDVVSFSSNSVNLTYSGNPLAPTVGPGGQVITFDLGDVVNSDGDNAVTETFTLVYRAVVLNVAGNQAGTTLNNSAVVSWDTGSLAAVAAEELTVVEPQLDTAKSVTVNGSGTVGDAGDPVVYTITLTNTGSVTAFNATFSDPLPVQITGASISAVTGAAVLADFTISGSTVETSSPSGLALAPGDVVTITVTGTLASGVTTGQSIANTATIQWTSLSGDYSSPRSPWNTDSVERTGAGGINDYTDSSTATLTIFAPNPTKSLATTSEASTTGSQVAVGEIVRYRLVTRTAEGTNIDMKFQDLLPTGLTFLDDGTAKAAFVATTSMTSSTLSGAGLFVAGDETTLAAITPTFVLPDAAVSSSSVLDDDTYASGTDVWFKLGDVVNGDRDGTPASNFEYVVVEFNALVDNSTAGSNDAGDHRDNALRLLIDGTQVGSDSNSVRVTVAEPSLGIGKATWATTGSVVTYRVTVTAASGSDRTTAFDVRVLDALNGVTLTLVASSVATVGTTGTVGAISDNSAGNTVDVVITSMAPGSTVTLEYKANVLGAPGVGTTYDNTAQVTYTSLPGGGTAPNPTGSVTPGPQGGANGERDGSGSPSQNDYAAQDTEKLGAIGDTVWYDRNDDGSQQVGEPGIPGAPVTVTWAGPDGDFGTVGDNSVITVFTGPGGQYTVAGLPVDSPGQFRVSVDTSAAVFVSNGLTTPTYDADGLGSANQSTVGLTSAVPVNLGQDFGYRGVGVIGDTVFLDVNASGTFNAGEGLSGVTVTLTYSLFGSPQTVTATTNASGTYTFTNLPVGAAGSPITSTVTVGAGLPAGVVCTVDPDSVKNGVSQVTLTPASPTNLAQDFGYRGTGKIGDTVFLDVNNNSLYDPGEGLMGVTVTLSMVINGQPMSFTRVTDGDGQYLFATLPTNLTYTVSVTGGLPAGVVNTVDPNGGNDSTSQATLTAPSPTNLAQDFGYRGTSSLSGTVYLDNDTSGSLTGGDTGIGNVPVTLTWYGPDGIPGNADDVTSTTLTLPNGTYSFTGLPAGTYALRETQPNYADGADTVGSLGGNNLWDDNIRFISVGTGQSGTGYNFGELPPPAIAATDVSSQTASQMCGVAYSRATGNYSGILRITNTGSSTYTGKIKVVLKNLPAGVVIRNSNVKYTADGDPFLIVNVGTLAPGGSVNVTLQFTNPLSQVMSFTTQVYTGTF